MILLIDNYDSFVHNLARYFERLGLPTQVVRNDAINAVSVRAMCPMAVVLSPGPCTPCEAGASLDIVRALRDELPILGVCLGHQIIAEAYGASIVRAATPVHGQTSPIRHDGTGLFAAVPSPLVVGRYHSLVVEPKSLPSKLAPTAWTDDGVMMAFAHRIRPVFGVQFHPESILTECGYQLLVNFVRLAGGDVSRDAGTLSAGELREPLTESQPLPREPVTF